MKLLNNAKGIALTELLAAIPLTILVFVILIIGIVNFVTTYQEVRLYTQLQEELFDAVETMRYGYTKADVTGGINDLDREKEGLIGLLTARKVEFGTGGSITIYPPSVDQTFGEEGYWSRFYLDENKHLRVSARYGVKVFQNELVFPSGINKVGNDYQFQITELNFTPIKSIQDKIYVLGIHIKARVRFREKLKDQSIEDDINLNTKSIEYNTSVYMANANKKK